jgi:predicted transposase/invertase (TIGR01784 family)
MEKGNEKKIRGKEELDIAYQNKDITSKILAEEFKGKSFAVYGVDIPQIVSVEPTNLPAIEANELRMDNLFLLEDGSYLLVDYESVYDEANKVKYLGYVVRVSQRLYNRFKRYPKVRMLVIYTADVKKGSTDPVLDIGDLRFEIEEAFLSEIDSETVWQNVSGTIENGKQLDSKEVMELIIYPLSFAKMEDKQQAVGEVISLVSKLEDEKTKRFILKFLLVFADKIIKDEDSKRIKEVFMIRYSEIETKIIQGAKIDGAKEIAKNMLEDGDSIEKVARITGLSKETVTEISDAISKQLVEN